MPPAEGTDFRLSSSTRPHVGLLCKVCSCCYLISTILNTLCFVKIMKEKNVETEMVAPFFTAEEEADCLSFRQFDEGVVRRVIHNFLYHV